MRDDDEWKKTYDLEEAVKAADDKIKEAVALSVQARYGLVVNALKRFATWVPDYFPGEQKLTKEEQEELRGCPFVTETYLYHLLGKEEGRTFLALFRNICEAVGVRSYRDLQREFFDKQEAAEKAEEEREARVRANTIKYKLAGHTFQKTGGCKVCVEKYGVEALKKRYGDADADRCTHWSLRQRAEALTEEDLKAPAANTTAEEKK